MCSHPTSPLFPAPTTATPSSASVVAPRRCCCCCCCCCFLPAAVAGAAAVARMGKSSGRNSNDYRKLQNMIKDLKVVKSELLPGQHVENQQDAGLRRKMQRQQRVQGVLACACSGAGGSSADERVCMYARFAVLSLPSRRCFCFLVALRDSVMSPHAVPFLAVQTRRMWRRRRRWPRSTTSSARSTSSTRCSTRSERSASQREGGAVGSVEGTLALLAVF